MLKEGFTLKNYTCATTSKTVKLKDLFDGKKYLVLYFYPKDATPGCTVESNDFAKNYNNFHLANTQIVGISRDPIKSHIRFIEKNELPFELISDNDEVICQDLELIVEKNMFGKKAFGLKRTTLILNQNLTVVKMYDKVKPEGHATSVLADIQAL